MSPKEQAENIRFKCSDLLMNCDLFKVGDNLTTLIHASCLNCVDEIISELEKTNKSTIHTIATTGMAPDDRFEYWQEVKNELEKM